MRKNLIVPAGMKDMLPGEAARKRELESALMAHFSSWGYREVGTSALEYYDVVARDGMDPAEVFKLIDREGQILALRPDVTTPIARMTATRLKEETLPLRLCYTGSTFRYEKVQVGRQREFTQAGVELIGSDSLMADIEVLVMAIEAMELAGLDSFRMGIGEINVTEGFLKELLPEEEAAEARDLIVSKDFVGLEALLGRSADPARAEVFLSLVTQNGGAEILDEIGRYSDRPAYRAAVAGLRTLARVLEEYGYLNRVFFDFSILRNFRYYTGLVFEGYAGGLGHPVCGGGRYDRLLGSFGYDAPAVGFALGLERALLAHGQDRSRENPDILILGEDYGEILKTARTLRQEGRKVEIDLTSVSLEEARQSADSRGIGRIYVVEGGNGHGK